MTNAHSKIQSFLKMNDGWHYGTGRAPSASIAGRAQAMSDYFGMSGFTETDAFPGIDGEIMIAAYIGKNCVEVTLEVNKTFRVKYEYNNEEKEYFDGLSANDMSRCLNDIVSKVLPQSWHSSALFTQNTMTQTVQNSSIWPSALNQGPQRYHVSKSAAPLPAADQFVLTPEDFTTPLPTTRQFSGSSTNPSYQMEAA